ncbi:hypothetical protein FA15DRAFT_589155 [Coprinopsis marcescibilis]|uniref:Uncharacterized protein n=1 Tax=Coprinopsis marcescibilis TaxID=230819 RepID=A0A5C3KZI0_COPMA|nr:hypothetical protein FA15DRAFT_589155 [Coprinopsis marcescibilis]
MFRSDVDPFSPARFEHAPQGSSHTKGSKTPDGGRESPALRWDQLRQHVLPPSRPQTPTQVPRPPSAASNRPTTPKPSRFPKLGFRQVVDQVKEVGENRKFADEISRVCFAIRYTEAEAPRGKNEKDGSQSTIAGGSSIALPFMSNTNTLNNTGATKKSDKRQSTAPGFPTVHKRVSLKALYQLLLYNSAPSPETNFSTYLPHEDQVLSTLLGPFTVPSRSPKWEEERSIAVDTFELISKGWLVRDEATSLQRCIWCCRAAMIPSSTTRTRILALIWRLTAPGERTKAYSIHAFQTISHHLLMTLAFLHAPQSGTFNENESQSLRDIIKKFISGSYGELSESQVEEEYGVVWLPEDSRSALRTAIFLEALAKCLENCSHVTRVWLLLNAVEDYWEQPSQTQPFTALQSIVHARKLNTFCKASSVLLQEKSLDPGEKLAAAQQIVTLLQNRVMPETHLVDQTTALTCRGYIAQVVLELLSLDNAKEIVRWAATQACRWLHDEDSQWRASFDKTLSRAISDNPWPGVVQLFARILDQLPDRDRKTVVATALPLLNDRILNDPPPYPNIELGNLLNSLSRQYPPIFFKPLFLCAASNKELTVVNHLCTLVVYSKFVEDLWFRDAEMMSIALLSDIGASNEVSELYSEGVLWGVARLGQTMLMVEFIGRLQALRQRKETSAVSTDITYRFIVSLESRLSILIEAKEEKAQIPPSQRALLCMMFRELRLISKSLKPALWLGRTIQWFIKFFEDEDAVDDLEQESIGTMELVQGLFNAARDSAHRTQNRRTTLLLSTTQYSAPQGISAIDESVLNLGSLFQEREPLIQGLVKGFISKALKLLVAVSPLLSEDDYLELGPILWEHCLATNVDSPSTAPACFLLMQCAEKTTLRFLAVIEVDIQSSDERTRSEAVQKMGVLVNWRFQIMSQNHISDRTHRPFKMARLPLPFVATDMGTTLYVPTEDTSDAHEQEIPAELRKQLADLGWVEDNAGPTDPQRERRRTPMSLLPITQLEKMEFSANLNDTSAFSNTASGGTSPFPSPSPRRGLKPQREGEDPGLLRRSSTSGGFQSTQKRRAIFVPPLTLIFVRMSKLIYDPNCLVAAATRGILFDLMRNDPPLLTRPVVDLLSGEDRNVSAAATTFSTYLHAHQILPPAMTHNIFNNIMGFLKYASRQLDSAETLREYALTLPILATTITQVNGMNMKEIRRSKSDPYVVPSGAFWFADSAPKGPMFPRGLEDFANPFEDSDFTTRVVLTTIIRTSQNLLYLAMLKRSSQDVTLIRKHATRLVLPSLTPESLDPRPLDLTEMLPSTSPVNPPETTIEIYSSIFARSHLMLVAQIFRSMSRHLSDRNELALWIDGINKILCKHGHEIGIVGHALIALMVATTRFRRLFTTGTAYTLFMPVLIKVYAEATHPGIRPAIEYAVNRFYALHKEAFLYQSLGAIGKLTMLPACDGPSLARSVYNLFFSLTKGSSALIIDAAGIHNINKSQEREALMVNTAEEKPQTFLAGLRKTESQTNAQLSTLFPEEYETDRLRMDNFIRLFLTVIAHDLSIIRAQNYLRLLRLLTTHLYQCSSSARNVLVEGIGALGSILLKGVAKSKITEAAMPRTADDYTLLPSHSNMESHTVEQASVQSDLKAMRVDYLSLVVAFAKADGDVSSKVAQRAIDIFKIILKDPPSDANQSMATLLSDFVETILIREELREPKAAAIFLKGLAPLLMYAPTIDMTGIFTTIHRLTLSQPHASYRGLSQVIVGEICTAGLAACEVAASANNLQKLPYRTALVRLVTDCVFLEGADIIAEIEKRTPTFAFLAGVVLPIALAMKTDAQINADGLRTQERHRSVLASAWLRLLFYIVAACRRSVRPETLPATKSRDKNAQNDRAQIKAKLSVFVIALQVLKIIVIRAEDDISAAMPGIWQRVGSFLKDMLTDGNADFAGRMEISSAVNSPMASPRVSAQFESPSMAFGNSASANGLRISIQDNFIFSRPRVIDYVLWSVLEFLWAYRTPLRLQLHLLTTEKMIAIDNDLRRIQHPSSTGSARKWRLSSVFSKVRSRASGMAPSPDASPRLSAMNSASFLEPTPTFLDVRRPGYQVSPISPSERRPFGAPQIVHLGPTSASAFHDPPPSPGGLPSAVKSLVRPIKIRSPKLAEATYRRIRGVQALMGYELLLPLPVGLHEEEDEVLKTWTRSQALLAISTETKDLLDEFEQTAVLADDDDDDVIDFNLEVPDNTTSATTSPKQSAFTFSA